MISKLIGEKKYESLSNYLTEIGNELGGWLKTQTRKSRSSSLESNRLIQEIKN